MAQPVSKITWRNKLFLLFTSKTFFFILIVIMLMAQIWRIRDVPLEEVHYSAVDLPNVVVHIDLKEAPKLVYLESLLPMFKKYGVTGLLMEYEDMFPYEGSLVNISAKNCYGKIELYNFLAQALQYQIEIIPMVQTLGNMEHVLKLQEFMHLRKTPKLPDKISPYKSKSKDLVKNILKQVINFHNALSPLRHIHIGCKHKFYGNKRANYSSRGTDMKTFIDHLKYITSFLETKNLNLTVLVFEDIFRRVKPLEWGTLDLPKTIEIVSWDNKPNITIKNTQLSQYHEECDGLWVASAFKGDPSNTLPKLQERYLNHYNWMNFLLDFRFGGSRNVYSFRGIILTGWYKSSHIGAPSELLLPSIPSLVLNLLIIRQFKLGVPFLNTEDGIYRLIRDDFYDFLKCNDTVVPKNFSKINLSLCNFQGKDLYNVLKRYEDKKCEEYDKLDSILHTLEFQASINMINPNNIITSSHRFNNTLSNLQGFEDNLKYLMTEFYSENVIDEYSRYKTYVYKKKLQAILNVLQNYSEVRVWERNPLNISLF